jgi:hypothetical protein
MLLMIMATIVWGKPAPNLVCLDNQRRSTFRRS